MAKPKENLTGAVSDKYQEALAHPEVIENTATQIFDAIKTADYNKDWLINDTWHHFLPQNASYEVSHGYPDWVLWMCRTFKENPIVLIELGKVFKDKDGRPAIPYKLTLKDGKILSGTLPFEYDSKDQTWYGMHGMDWHLRPNPYQP